MSSLSDERRLPVNPSTDDAASDCVSHFSRELMFSSGAPTVHRDGWVVACTVEVAGGRGRGWTWCSAPGLQRCIRDVRVSACAVEVAGGVGGAEHDVQLRGSNGGRIVLFFITNKRMSFVCAGLVQCLFTRLYGFQCNKFPKTGRIAWKLPPSQSSVVNRAESSFFRNHPRRWTSIARSCWVGRGANNWPVHGHG